MYVQDNVQLILKIKLQKESDVLFKNDNGH